MPSRMVSLVLLTFLSAGALARAAEHPVLVVPGLPGSWSTELFCNDAKQVADFERRLAAARWLPRFEATATVPNQWQLDPILHTYDRLIAAINESPGFIAIPVPWDWRRPFHLEMEGRLIPAIQQAKTAFGVPRVSIVAHSAGGLLVRDYVQTHYANDIDRIVFLGTPQRGVVDAYLGWEGGKASEAMPAGVFGTRRITRRIQEAFQEMLLEDMKQGCGCSAFTSDFAFIHKGCSGAGPLYGIRDLLPTFPYIKKTRLPFVPLTPVENMCEENQNQWLFNLERNAAAFAAARIPVRIFTGATLTTMKSITVGFELGSCDTKWADGDPKNKNRDSRSGDGRVPTKSACPADSIPAFAGIPCITEDQVHPGKKPIKPVSHGALPTIFKEEVVAFLEEPHCGNTFIEGNEQCDDGNTVDGDCCSHDCNNEPAGTQTCGQGVCAKTIAKCENGSSITCVPGDPTESGREATCDDTLDNDCDGLEDCEDGDPCTLNDRCSGSVCVPGTARPCPDGIIEDECGEVCDGDNLAGKTCADLGFVGSVPRCAQDCLSFDTSSCTADGCVPGKQRSCYDGPADTEGVGACHAGIATCLPDGSDFGPCEGEVGPGVEVCDGADNDCNGSIDNGVVGPCFGFKVDHDPRAEGTPCASGAPGCVVTHPHFLRDIAISFTLSSNTVLTVTPQSGTPDDITYSIDHMERDNGGPLTPPDYNNCAAADPAQCPSQGNGVGDTEDDLTNTAATLTADEMSRFQFIFHTDLSQLALGFPYQNKSKTITISPKDGAYPKIVLQVNRGNAPGGRYILYFRARSASGFSTGEPIVLVIGSETPGFGEK